MYSFCRFGFRNDPIILAARLAHVASSILTATMAFVVAAVQQPRDVSRAMDCFGGTAQAGLSLIEERP